MSGRIVAANAAALAGYDTSAGTIRFPIGQPLPTRIVRRSFDVAVSAIALVLLSPIVLLSALAVRVDSPGPALFRQPRLGRGGKRFRILKLRGMYVDAKERFPHLYDYRYSTEEARELQFHIEDDPRVTRAGRLFRKTSIDELMNFWNVLVGDMALVGPRPTIQAQVDQYTERQRRRLEVRPGITGWAQVNGRASLPWHERIELDVWYLEHRSTVLDLQILGRTLRLLLTGPGLYRGETGGWRPDAPAIGPARADGRASPRRHSRRGGRKPRWRRRRPSSQGRS